MLSPKEHSAYVLVAEDALGVVRVTERTETLELAGFNPVRRRRRELAPVCADAEGSESSLDRGDGVLRLFQ